MRRVGSAFSIGKMSITVKRESFNERALFFMYVCLVFMKKLRKGVDFF